MALIGGPDVWRYDAQRRADLLWCRCRRLNATYPWVANRAACPRGPRVGCRLRQPRGETPLGIRRRTRRNATRRWNPF